MDLALRLAMRGLGDVWPNPAVGCVLVDPVKNQVVGRGWTQPGGRPHAETVALERAGERSRGTTAYVTLEPCRHQGETPPCTDALIAAGVARVVVACTDPDPRNGGAGLEELRSTGIQVEVGVRQDQAAHVLAGFALKTEKSRPLVTLKMAATLDGRIATRTGDSRWVSGHLARRFAHLLRASHDAVLVGINTVLADDPRLTCRLPGMANRSPVRVVLDTEGRFPSVGRLLDDPDDTPLWVITGENVQLDFGSNAHAEQIALAVDPETDRPNPKAVLGAIAQKGITRVLIEGGGTVASSFIASGLVDRLVWIGAPNIVGGDGLPSVAAMGIDRMEKAPRYQLDGWRRFGSDSVFFLNASSESECSPES